MKSIKTHFGVIFSLVALLFSIQFGIFLGNLINAYEISMKEEYNIIIASKKALVLTDVASKADEVAQINSIDTNYIFEKLDGKISKDNMRNLKSSLPKFYSVKLQFFPNSDELKTISSKLENVDGVSKVEVFSKAHDNIYRILILIKSIIIIFTFLIVVLGIMLIQKQMRIWIFEHKERIEVMNLLGASFFLKSAKLYRMTFTDAIISTIIVTAIYVFLEHTDIFIGTMSIIGISIKAIYLIKDVGILLLCSVVIGIIAVSVVMLQIGNKNK